MFFSGSMTTRIVWGLTIQAVIFVFTVIMAMADTSGFPIAFFWMTMVSVVILNSKSTPDVNYLLNDAVDEDL